MERTKRELGVLTRCLGEAAAGVRLGGVCSERPGIGRPLQQNKPTRETSWKANKQADNFNNPAPQPLDECVKFLMCEASAPRWETVWVELEAANTCRAPPVKSHAPI